MNPKTPHRDALLRNVNQYRQPMLDFLRDLVRIPSVNRRDPESNVVRRIIAEAVNVGLDHSTPAVDPARPNALVQYGNGEAGFAIIAHVDTVSEGTLENWHHPPFGADVANGMLYGRGAADNKAGIACGMYTLVALRDMGLLDSRKHRVVLAGVADEESGAHSDLGAKYLLQKGCFTGVKGAIYAYTSDVVCIGHRGLLRLEITARGESIHAGLEAWHKKEHGANAVTALADVILGLEELHIGTIAEPGFENLGCTITPGTIIRGGVYESIVPDFATALVDIRLMPGQDAEAVLHEVDEVLRGVRSKRPANSFSVEIKTRIPGASITPSHPLAVLAQEYTERITGVRWKAVGAGPGNEGYMFIGAGIPILPGFGPAGGNPHAADEWVSIESLPGTVAMYCGIISEFLYNY